MNAQRLLAELERSGVVLAPRGARLHVDAPRGVLTEEIRQQLVQRKPELLRLARVAAMRLDEFAQAGLIVQVFSDRLGVELLFVSDDVPQSALEGRPEVIYRAFELKKLARLRPDPLHLRDFHMVKEIVGGTILEVREADDGEDADTAQPS